MDSILVGEVTENFENFVTISGLQPFTTYEIVLIESSNEIIRTTAVTAPGGKLRLLYRLSQNLRPEFRKVVYFKSMVYFQSVD